MRHGPALLICGGALTVILGSVGFSFAARAYRPAFASLATASPLVEEKTSPTAPLAALPPTAGSRTGTPVGPGTPIARISIPRIGIVNAPVFERGVDSKGTMAIAPGYAVTHYSFSARFGAGNAVIYGHDDIQGNIFGHLYDLRPGDTVQISLAGETQIYRVSDHQIVAPTAVSVLAPTSDARLTIITCWPYNVDSKRWIVTALKA